MHDTPMVPEVSLPHPRAAEPCSKFQLFEDIGQFAPESIGICESRELSEGTNICHDSGRFQCGSACWEGEHLLCGDQTRHNCYLRLHLRSLHASGWAVEGLEAVLVRGSHGTSIYEGRPEGYVDNDENGARERRGSEYNLQPSL